MPTFSIIIPTFNSDATLDAALASVKSQNIASVEVCIIDGGSTDGTETIVQQWQAELSLQWYQEPDEGIYDAMNKGLDIASGEWVIFMGSDDTFFESTTLQKVYDFLKATDASVIYGNAKIIGNTGWAQDGDVYDGPFTLKKLINKNICHQAIFYKRAFIRDEIGYFNLKYSQCSDWDFNLRCWAKAPFAYIDMIISKFAAGGASSHIEDRLFMKEVTLNIIDYFKISPFNKLINDINFIRYQDVITLQKTKYPLAYKFQWLFNFFKK